MQEYLGAAPYERADGRQGYRAGYYSRSLVTRVGPLELRVPQDREGNFSTEVEDNIEETLSFYRLPRPHHKHMRSTNLLERFNQEIKRRTHIVRIFPNAESCWRLVTALAAEQHEEWQEGSRYVDMGLLMELRKERMRQIETEAA